MKAIEVVVESTAVTVSDVQLRRLPFASTVAEVPIQKEGVARNPCGFR